MAEHLDTPPMAPAPWDTTENRNIQHEFYGQIWPVCGDSIAKDPDFAREFPTLESYLESLEPPC